jgi:hypothetical protein
VAAGAGIATALCGVGLRLVGPAGSLAEAAAQVAGGMLVAGVAGYAAMRLMKVEELATLESLAASLARRFRGR